MKTRTQIPKYVYSEPINLKKRNWPDQIITKSPTWCSVDLRDGNQALPNPMSVQQKQEYFKLLCSIGFKEIEVAFPSASEADYNFTRYLIEENLIPEDVFIMSFVQCRENLIEKTFNALKNIKQGIMHLYCATSELHMKQVFNMTRDETLKMIINAVEHVKQRTNNIKSDIRLEFSPEEFSDSDLDFILDICIAVYEIWGKAKQDKPLIINLPATVERRPPNQYADMIEWFCQNFPYKKNTIISVHTHNDQGMATAATEMALLAGAQRVEGTLFGHGERTGNVDLVTLANNLFIRGIDTQLNFSNLKDIAQKVEKLTGMPIYYRQPYSGKYVFTAFSGSHQDAIRKGMYKKQEITQIFNIGWKMPYLIIDPDDIGRKHENIIRINSQSGKGGMSWILEQHYNIQIPKGFQIEFANIIQQYSDQKKREITEEEIFQIFQENYIKINGPIKLISYWANPDKKNPSKIKAKIDLIIYGKKQTLSADGNGPIDAFVNGIKKTGILEFNIEDYDEQSIGKGSQAQAIAFVPIKIKSEEIYYGAGIDTNIDQAAVKAIVSAINHVL